MSSPVTQYPPPATGNSNLKTALAGGAIAALLVSNIYLFVQIHDMKADAVKSRDSIQAELENLKENSTVITATNRKHLDTLREELDNARRQASMAASQAKSEALTHAEQLAKKLEQEQQQGQQKLSGDINQVKEAANTANTKIDSVNTDVSNVKTQVASNKSDLDKTITDLKKVRGDLTETSSYVATNKTELAALRRLGERNITEFKLAKTKAPQRVGDISLQLKKADPKRNKFTVAVLADDKMTEKKDRNINEPVQFYVAKAHQPYEIVVNQVGKDMISGYLSTPKDQVARN